MRTLRMLVCLVVSVSYGALANAENIPSAATGVVASRLPARHGNSLFH